MLNNRTSFVASPQFGVCAIVILNAISLFGTNFYYTDILLLHFIFVITGLGLEQLIRKRRPKVFNGYRKIPNIFFVEKCFAFLSFLVVVFLLVRAKADPLSYIFNLNYYRLSINNDVGYAKFVLNMWMVVGLIAYFFVKKSFSRYILLPGLINVFWGYRFCFAYALFSVLFSRLSRTRLKIGHILVVVSSFLIFSGFAIWRDSIYQNIQLPNLVEFMFNFSDSGLLAALAEHGFKAHFVADSNLSDAIALSNSGILKPHFGSEYIIEIFRLVGLGSVVGADISLDLKFNAFLRGVAPSDLLGFDAGGVIIGLPGSLMIAGGVIFLAIGSLIWAFTCAFIIRRFIVTQNPLYVAVLPYMLVIYQSPEANIPRILIMIVVYKLALIGVSVVRSSKKHNQAPIF